MNIFKDKKTKSAAWLAVTAVAFVLSCAVDYLYGPYNYYLINIIYIPVIIIGLIAIKND